MSKSTLDMYLDVMQKIRQRFDLIALLRGVEHPEQNFAIVEACALCARKSLMG